MLWREIQPRAAETCVEWIGRDWQYGLDYYAEPRLPSCDAEARALELVGEGGVRPAVRDVRGHHLELDALRAEVAEGERAVAVLRCEVVDESREPGRQRRGRTALGREARAEPEPVAAERTRQADREPQGERERQADERQDDARDHRADGERAFAVSFVSALAGTLLAAQLVREASGAKPVLGPGCSRGNFQLWRPDGSANAPRLIAPEPGCWCRAPVVRTTHKEMWHSSRR